MAEEKKEKVLMNLPLTPTDSALIVAGLHILKHLRGEIAEPVQALREKIAELAPEQRPENQKDWEGLTEEVSEAVLWSMSCEEIQMLNELRHIQEHSLLWLTTCLSVALDLREQRASSADFIGLLKELVSNDPSAKKERMH